VSTSCALFRRHQVGQSSYYLHSRKIYTCYKAECVYSDYDVYFISILSDKASGGEGVFVSKGEHPNIQLKRPGLVHWYGSLLALVFPMSTRYDLKLIDTLAPVAFASGPKFCP
jgi:hypothetical protein